MGMVDCVVVGGVESMSNVEYYMMDMCGGVWVGLVKLYDCLECGWECL